MSKKQWMVLLMLFLTYLLLGASIFYHIESHLEIERIEKAKRERIEINGVSESSLSVAQYETGRNTALLHAHYVPSRTHDHDEILGKLTRYCGKSVYNYTEGETDSLKWDFYNSFYFAYTVVSTIGYGNLAPTNILSRILMIFYGLIGIPMNGILLTQLGEFFGQVFVKAHQKYKSYKRGRNDYYPRKLTTFETRKVGLAAQIFAHLMPGFVMFIFFPAFLFSHYEGWSYDEAVYYAFVTLTTIGFGDYVAGQDNSKGSGIFFILYKAFLICWISFGLGYTVMIMTFIARGMRSKKITRIEHKLAINLKHTQSKIWNEFNKEINYLRRVFNELQLSKVKRVYVDECNYEAPRSKFPRSNSFPDLRDLLYGAKGKDGTCHRPRRRANSEVVPMDDQITRVVSETDLQRIDKTATFATHAMVQPAELLARLVNILGYIPPATEDLVGGGDCSNQTTFVEQDIRRSKFEENNDKEFARKESMMHPPHNSGLGIWSIGNDRISRFPKPRSRAASELRLYETRNEDRNVERTWSGPMATRKIQELMKTQLNEPSNKDRGGVKEAKPSKLRTFALAKSVPKALMSSGPWKSRFSASSEKKSSEFEQEASNNKDVGLSFVSALTRSDDRRDSSSTISNSNSRRHYYTHTGAANNIETESNSLLEETSLADFLRALTLLHASVATTDDDLIRRNQPRRKMGTASLTPPKLPSLFTLFSPSQAPSSAQSNQTTVTQEASTGYNNANGLPFGHETCQESRRSSLAFIAPTVTKSRRFSLRPVATPVSPPTPPRNGSPYLSDSRRMPYESKPTFLFESPKEPLIRTEGLPGLSSPITSSFNGRRFSLRPAQNHGGSSVGNGATALPTIKALPRWKAGMLQRQIGQMNLRRRARAFSLSDVHADDVTGKAEPFGLSSSVYKRNNRDTACKNVSLHEDSNYGETMTKSAKTLDQSVSSVRLEERQPSFSQETISTNIKPEDKNVHIIDPQAQSISSTISDKIDRSNVPTSCPRTDGGVSAESVPFESFRNRAENIWMMPDDAESPQPPLVEVKTENPVVNTVPLDITGLTIEKRRSNSHFSKS